MRRGSSVGVILLLALGFFAVPLQAQDSEARPPSVQERGFRLEQNYPNPFNPETRIPFILGDELFESGKPVVVSVRIYNVLQQLVAIPTALNTAEGSGLAVDGLEYTTPGRKVAYWDGFDRAGRQVASGVYYVQLVVNGQSTYKKMVVAK